eukprot:jgi/Bigna1/128740/aug1.7_g3448
MSAKKGIKLPLAGHKTLREGKAEFLGFRAPNKDVLHDHLYTINTADDPTYISMLKSDIYQVQRRLEKAKRGLVQMMGSRPTSARGRDIHAITEATSEVDAIIRENAKKKSRIKLKLTELLNAKMVLLETVILRLADGARVFRNVSNNYGAPSMSRLPAFLEIVDQLLALQRMAARTPMKLDSEMELDKLDSAPLPKAIKKLENQLQKLGSDLDLPWKTYSSEELSATRVDNAASFLGTLTQSCIAPLQSKLKDAVGTNAKLKNDSEKLHKHLEEAHAKIQDLSSSSSSSSSSSAPTTSTSSNMNTKKELKELEGRYKKVQAELESLRRRKGQKEDATAEAVESVREELGIEISRLKGNMSDKEMQLAKAREELAECQNRLDETARQADESQKAEKLARKKATSDSSLLESQKEALEKRIKILEEKNKGLEDTLAGRGADVLNEALKKELEAAKNEIEKRQKTLAGLDIIKRDFEKERAQWKSEEKLKEEHIKKLKDMVQKAEKNNEDGEETFEDILREEMRVMKAAFELKMSNLREELAQKSIACSREVRLLKSELESERRTSSSLTSKLKAFEASADSKKQTEILVRYAREHDATLTRDVVWLITVIAE